MKYILLFFVLVGCSKQIDHEPQYKLGDEVTMRGFYEKCTGIVLNFSSPNKYIVKLTCQMPGYVSVFGQEVVYSDISGLKEQNVG